MKTRKNAIISLFNKPKTTEEDDADLIDFKKKLNTHLDFIIDQCGIDRPLPSYHVLQTALITLMDKSFLKIAHSIFDDQELAKKLATIYSKLPLLELFDGGVSIEPWALFSKQLISCAPPKHQSSSKSFKKITIKNGEIASHPYFFEEKEIEGWQFLRLQGRTILFTNHSQDILAVKIQKTKQEEDEKELIKEFNTTTFLKKYASQLRLKSYIPDSIDIYNVSSVFEWLESQSVDQQSFALFKNMVNHEAMYIAYIYQVNHANTDYFTYLHDDVLTENQFITANYYAIHDLYILFIHGIIFPQLADIFHNSRASRADSGRYIVLTNLLARVSFYGEKTSKGPPGTGRLTGWLEAVAYPNIRGSGLADFGDWAPITEFLGPSERIKKYYSAALLQYKEQIGNYLLANIMAEYQYVLYLIAGRRGRNLTLKAQATNCSPEDIQGTWRKLANQIVDNCAHAISLVTSMSKKQAKYFLLTMTNTNRLSRQMQFWMTDEYISHVQQNKIPADIYDESTLIKLNVEKFREHTFNSTIGFSINGKDPDLGPVNGQEPVKELGLLIYWMVNTIFINYYQHCIMHESSKEISPKNQTNKNQTENAARVIQKFWRQHTTRRHLFFTKNKDQLSCRDSMHNPSRPHLSSLF